MFGSAIGFVESEVATIERYVYQLEYGDIQYQRFCPISTDPAHPWADSITYYSMDGHGAAQWFNPQASDVPLADTTRQQFNRNVEGAAIGYTYHLGEVGQALLIDNFEIPSDRAYTAHRAAQEFLDDVALRGGHSVDWEGLINAGPNLLRPNVAPRGASDRRSWEHKTAAEIAKDVNDAITRIWTHTRHQRIPNQVLLPSKAFAHIVTTPLGGDESQTIMDFVLKHNIYTVETGQQLSVDVIRGLESAGQHNTGRMIVYCLAEDVLKFHLPLPFRFMPVHQTGPLNFLVAGFMRTGGLEIRLPGCMDYTDEIWGDIGTTPQQAFWTWPIRMGETTRWG